MISSGVKQVLHPAYDNILFGPPLLAVTILGPHKNQFTPSLHSAPLQHLWYLVPITIWSYVVLLMFYYVSQFFTIQR